MGELTGGTCLTCAVRIELAGNVGRVWSSQQGQKMILSDAYTEACSLLALGGLRGPLKLAMPLNSLCMAGKGALELRLWPAAGTDTPFPFIPAIVLPFRPLCAMSW